MEASPISRILADTSLVWIGAGIFASLLAAEALGNALSKRRQRASPMSEEDAGQAQTQEGYLVSGILLLLGLLLGFTFSIAVERFEQRRLLVVSEANAIGTAYLRSQILDEPHRTRLSRLLSAYTDNRVRLGAISAKDKPSLLASNDQLLLEIWAAVTAASGSARDKGISVPLLAAFNEVIDRDTDRKVARLSRVPEAVLVTVFAFMIVTAIMLGNVLTLLRERMTAVVLFLLLTMSICIILDLNRPVSGTIRESQLPLIMLRDSLMREPLTTFDQFREGSSP